MRTVLKITLVLLCLVNAGIVQADKKSKYVNLFIGTAGDNGQVDPAACVPYGMVRICPDSDPRSHVGYDYDVNNISGFSINRISGIGCGGAGGNLSLKPAGKYSKVSINKATEVAEPGYYSVSTYDPVKAEFTATNNVAIERYYYARGAEAFMTLNIGSSFSKVLDANYKVVSPKEIQGYIHSTNTCDHGAYKLYFNITVNKPFTVVSEDKHILELSFGGD